MLGQDRFIVRQCKRGHCKQAALFTEKEISPPHKLMSARLVPRPSACVIRSFPLRQSGASPSPSDTGPNPSSTTPCVTEWSTSIPGLVLRDTLPHASSQQSASARQAFGFILQPLEPNTGAVVS
jgi:hypothetical protein